ncbi:hypothetical protein SEA_SCOUT_5 [Mycobacterium phage Scout]|uniref:Glycine-rich domain-containing protein n=1 Tax=Mycobacterium phage Scout TaxID=2836023 RepID=A0A8F3E1B1_9CAUD|nr:hypothetical protein SEA_SCOUT_5 [Mycobacterium phage Scout]
MAIRLGSVNPNAFRVGTQTPSRIFLGNDLVWPAFTPQEQIFNVVGAYTYNIPANCRFIDVILLGGGGGGKGLGLIGLWGEGGKAGTWQAFTLQRGVHIPWSATQIVGQIGAGGAQSNTSGGNGGSGEPTTAVVPVFGTVAAAGGDGGTQQNLDTPGKSPGNITHNGRTYVGGAQQNSPQTAGNPPGGGGGGATITFGRGGAGARGQAWFYAYI